LHQGATVFTANRTLLIHGLMAWTLLIEFIFAFTLLFFLALARALSPSKYWAWPERYQVVLDEALVQRRREGVR